MFAVLDFFKNERVTVGFAAAVIVAFIAIQQWAEVNFVTVASAEQSMQSLSNQIQANGTLISDHIDVYEKNENKKAILVVKEQQFELRQFVSANGTNSMTLDREEELKLKLVDLNDTKTCLQMGGDNC